MATSCVHCKHLLGCHLLFGNNGLFDAERLLLSESAKDCPKFEEVGVRETDVRDWCYKHFGQGYLRTLHGLPELMMEGLRQGEKDELMYENIPNFMSSVLLREGMTSVEREEVLRYQTDENGRVIVEVDSEGVEHKLARPEYHIKAYAVDPDKPIALDKAVAWAWNIAQVVDHIIKREAELGLIVKTKKTSAAKPTNQPQERETNMAGSPVRTIIRRGPAGTASAKAPAQTQAAPAAAQAPATTAVRRANPKPAPAPTPAPQTQARVATAPAVAGKVAPRPAPAPVGRVANPPARRIATPGSVPAPASTQVAPKAAPSPSPSMSTDVLESSVFKVMNPMIEELRNEILALKKQQDVRFEEVKDEITILHDIAAQTSGTFQIKKVDSEGNILVRADGTPIMEAPQLFAHPSKILAYAENVAYNAENMQVIGDDVPEEVYVQGSEEGQPEDVPSEEVVEEEVVQEGEA